MMILHCLWLIITLQEKTWIQNAKKLAEEDRLNNDDIGPNEQIQGTALAYEMTPPSLAVRSALRLQFWIFYWNLLREQVRLTKTLPASLTETGQPVPNTAKLIPVLTENIDLLNNYMDIEAISLRSLMKRGLSLSFFIKLASYYQKLHYPVDFIIIYIREAHASDAWKFDGNEYSFIRNHRNINERLDAIKIMVEMANITKDKNIHIYSDTMDDRTNHLFRAWPERLYVLYDEKILYQGQKGPSGYSIPSLDYFLKKNIIIQN
ncbi:unnamed protein product [Rotaria sp. Silwood2]|nr:unnamed protein product [Rotaria sp. Silwood2]CAF4069377.1 unnamed protein product [Rotaria sp. Silwood2]